MISLAHTLTWGCLIAAAVDASGSAANKNKLYGFYEF